AQRDRGPAPARLQRDGHREDLERQPAADLARGRTDRPRAAAGCAAMRARALFACACLLHGALAVAADRAALDRTFEDLHARYALPGLAIGVIEDGKVVYARTAGERVAGTGDAITSK